MQISEHEGQQPVDNPDLTVMHPDDVWARYGQLGINEQQRQIREQKELRHQMQQNEQQRVRLLGDDEPSTTIRFHLPPYTDDDGMRRRQDANERLLANATARYVVATGAQIDLEDGTKLTGGMECDISRHLRGDQGIAHTLKAKRVLLELSEERLRARTCSARYRYTQKMLSGSGAGSFVVRNPQRPNCGIILVPGDGALPGHFGSDGFAGGVDARFPEGDPRRQLAAVMPTDGMARFRDLIASGAIEDRGPSFGPHYTGGPEPVTATAAAARKAG